METKINKKLPKGQRRQRISDWQEKLPVKLILVIAIILLVLALLIMLNESSSSLLNSPELDVLRSSRTLRVGIDTNRVGLNVDGTGYEDDLIKLLGQTIFNADDCVSFVELDRHTVLMAFEDDTIDLALMSIDAIDQKGYSACKRPFYSEPCVLLTRDSNASFVEMQVAVLNGTPAHTLLKKSEEDIESEIIIVPSAAYYDMLVLFRAGRVDALCMPLSVAETFREPSWTYHATRVGTLNYYAVSTSDNKVLIDLIDELLLDWSADGVLTELYSKNGL